MQKPDAFIFTALQNFAAEVTRKMKALAAGEREDQLRAPFEKLITAFGKALGRRVIAKGESQLPDRLGRADYAILARGLLAGYAELKEPGKGANPFHYKAHDKQQWKRFQALPNIIYTDGNEWGLYRDGERVGKLVGLSSDVTKKGRSAVKPEDAGALKPLLTDFLSWEPIIPKDAKQLAELLAPLCFMLRQEVNDALKDQNSPLRQLAKDWRPDRYLRRLEAMMAVADKDVSLVISGTGDVLEPEDGLIGIGSGGSFALAAARALIDIDSMEAEDIARKAMGIAAGICVYTNENVIVEIL